MNTSVRQNNIVRFFAAILLLSISSLTHAGIGSVTVNSVTDTSINLSWTPPSGNYQLSGATYNYKICYEESGTWATVCGGGVVNYSNTNSYNITGLDPSKTYKIRVKCHCERKNIWGNWVNPKWRNIGTNVTSTNAASSGGTGGGTSTIPSNLIITGSSSFSLDASLTHNEMPLFDFVRVCYKKKYKIVTGFDSTCYSNPAFTWLYSDNKLGWFETAPSVPLNVTVHPSIDLKKCTRYKVIAYGKLANGVALKIGESEARTGVSCGLFNKSQLVVNDHVEDVLAAYVEKLERFYQKPLFTHLLENYDPTLLEAREVFLNDGDDIRNGINLIEYLVESGSETYSTWQQEAELNKNNLSLDSFLARNFPKINEQLAEEILVGR